jgi:hypothetical protein
MKTNLYTRNTGPQCNEGDSVDTVFKIDEASEMTSDITDNSSTGADEENGNDKSWVSIINC